MTMTIALVGNPNCGKTTVFNALTGAKQKVGNWPGVTVERKSGAFVLDGTSVEVVDLPGIYSLISVSAASSVDESIAADSILNQSVDVVVNILDANNLERNLYLTTQLIEMRVPIIIAVNMMDIAKQRGIRIDLAKLAEQLGCPVVGLEAHKNKGIKELKKTIVLAQLQPSQTQLSYPEDIQQAILQLSRAAGLNSVSHWAPRSRRGMTMSHWAAFRLLEDDWKLNQLATKETLVQVAYWQQRIRTNLQEDADILIADTRYRFIQQLMATCVQQTAQTTQTWTARIDNIVLNRMLGIPIFLCVMYALFFFAINIGGAFQDFFDISGNTIFVEGVAYVLTQLHCPVWLIALLANGVGKGITTTLTFIPVIGALFLFLAFLEGSGYMARASFVVDRLMRAMGLPGKSFVPMIVGFGCNVPSVMAARTLDHPRDRILTIMMSPFMSCGARLAIYAVFTAAFFPTGGQNVVFALYLIGIGMAMLTGLLLRKTVLKGESAPLVMELPPYHLPRLKTLGLLAWQRLKSFVLRAGKWIVPICMLIGLLNMLNIDGSLNAGEGSANSILSVLGQWLTPIFAPMGVQQENWPATVGLIMGVLAKEVVVGTLNTLYSQAAMLASAPEAFHFWGGLREAVASIPANLAELGNAFSNPVLAKAPVHMLSQDVYGVMAERFDGKVGAMAYLLFVLLYVPCVSTAAAIARELNRGWAFFSVLWTTGVAYGTAVGFYQLATWARHPVESLSWVGWILALFGLTIITIRLFPKNRRAV